MESVADWITTSGYKSPNWQGTNYFAFFPVNEGAFTLLKSDGQLAEIKELNACRSALRSWGGICDLLCSGLKIAGYSVLNSECVFMYDSESTELIAVRLDLNYTPYGDGKTFMADMLPKLRSVYGPGDLDDDTQYFKLGANGTAVLLHRNSLVYADTAAFARLDTLVTPLTVDGSDTGGL